jgi:plastocyanin
MSKLAGVLVGAIMLVAGFALMSGGFVRAESVTIEAGNMYFCSPAFENGVCETAVAAGDTVTWSNVAGFHTVTECTADFATCPPTGGFDSGVLEPNQTYAHTFQDPGSYSYYCTLHPTQMRGEILVSAVTPAPATPTPLESAPPATPVAGTVTSAPNAPSAVPATGGSPPGSGLIADMALAGSVLLWAAGAAFSVAASRR